MCVATLRCEMSEIHGFGWRVKNGEDWHRLRRTRSQQRIYISNSTVIINMFSVAVYYLTYVQDASATPGPCSRTAHRHTLLGTHWRTCGVKTSRSSSLTCGPWTARTWIQSITLFGVTCQARWTWRSHAAGTYVNVFLAVCDGAPSCCRIQE